MSSEGRLPGFDGATGWLNSPPLIAADLRGKVILVDFWTYTCINWLRTLAYVRAWAETYRDRGLVVVGVHTPEFPFEGDIENVREAAKALRVEFPIALDSDSGVWRAFGNRYWPAVYIADAEGRIRQHHFGEGAYDECEWAIQMFLGEAGDEGIGDDLVSVEPDGLEAQADWTNLGSPETYVGYEQGRNFASPGGAAFDEPHTYVAPDSLQLNQWALAGNREGRDTRVDRASRESARRAPSHRLPVAVSGLNSLPIADRVASTSTPRPIPANVGSSGKGAQVRCAGGLRRVPWQAVVHGAGRTPDQPRGLGHGDHEHG